jgi:hypothetical protein
MSTNFPKTIELDFVHLELHELYAIASIKEGVVFDRDHLKVYDKVFKEHYPERLFGYISNRKYDYTVNPTCFLQTNLSPRLVAVAMWCHTERSFNNALFERSFYKRPAEAFYTKEECQQWIIEQIEDYKEKAGL